MRPLQWIEQHSPNQGRARQIFLLTDGEISNVTEVLDLCRSMASSTRIFSFGLGKSPSRSLVKGLARSTNGRFVFIPPNSNVDIYVGEQLQKALQPCITNIDVQWNLGVNVRSAPTQSPPVYVNDRLIVYALKNDKTVPFDHNSSVQLKTKTDHRSLGIATIDRIPNMPENETIARLAAKALILELQHAKLPASTAKKMRTGSTQSRFQGMETSHEETMEVTTDEQTTKQRIVELSLKYNILSPHTAFVGIEKRTNASNAEMVLREVPIEISADDRYLQAPLPTLFCGAGGSRVRVSNVMPPNCGLGMRSGFRGGRGGGSAQGFSTHGRMESARSISQMDVPLEYAASSYRSNSALREQCRYESDQLQMRSQSSQQRSSKTQSNLDTSLNVSEKKEIWPSMDEDIIRYLINKQKYDGLWDVDTNVIMNLTGKPLSVFQATNNDISTQILISTIIVIMLETRFTTYSSLWHGVVQKARKQISNLITKDSKNFDKLMEDIRKQL
jgi:hypothetical protein